MESRARAVKGLVHLSLGELKSAESLLEGVQDSNLEDNTEQMGNAYLPNGLFLHATGNFSSAKGLCDRVLHVLSQKILLKFHI